MSIFDNLVSIPAMRPAFNIGSLFDIPTGTYQLGIHGESLLNSGLYHIVSLSGPPNAFKTVIILFINLTVADRYVQYKLTIYETEGSLTYYRINQLAKRLPNISKINHGSELLKPDEIRIKVTSSADILGDVYFDAIYVFVC